MSNFSPDKVLNSNMLVFTGKGGVGKTTCAAATGLHLAKSGYTTLVVSTDPAHSLGDALQLRLGGEPQAVVDNLDAMELDATLEMRHKFQEVGDVLMHQMRKQGLSELIAEEMVAFPGAEEVFCLLKVIDIARTGEYKVIVIDTAPTGNTMRFLNFPAFLKPVEKALRIDCVYQKVTRPMRSLFGQESAKDTFYSTIFDLFRHVEEARLFLLNADVRFRLVMTPERLALIETQRAISFLNISGYAVDTVIVNKVIPNTVEDPFFTPLKEAQYAHLARAEQSFYPVRVLRAPLQQEEVLGTTKLQRFSRILYNGCNPAERFTYDSLFEICQNGKGIELRCQLPHENRSEIKLFRTGANLVLNVGYYEKHLHLPAALSARECRGARFEDNVLVISFE